VLNLSGVDVMEMIIISELKSNVKKSASRKRKCRNSAHWSMKLDFVDLTFGGSTSTPNREYAAHFSSAAMMEMKTILPPGRNACKCAGTYQTGKMTAKTAMKGQSIAT